MRAAMKMQCVMLVLMLTVVLSEGRWRWARRYRPHWRWNRHQRRWKRHGGDDGWYWQTRVPGEPVPQVTFVPVTTGPEAPIATNAPIITPGAPGGVLPTIAPGVPGGVLPNIAPIVPGGVMPTITPGAPGGVTRTSIPGVPGGVLPTSVPVALASVNTPAPPVPGGGGGSGLGSIMTAAVYASLKSSDPSCQGASLYSYENFMQAAQLFPAFGNTGDVTARKRDIAGFFAHVMHESNLCYVNEQGTAAQNPATYCRASAQYPCASGANYHGRGPLQLTWNFNYIEFGKTLPSATASAIYNNPAQVSASGVLLFQSALFTYMRPDQTPDSMHNLNMRNPPQFGQSTRVINGPLECNGGNTGQVQSRVTFFTRICQMLGVDPGNQLTC